MAVENFSGYTETDPNSHLTVTSTRVTWDGLHVDEDAYVYYDKGAGHFSGDFEHLITVYISDTSPAVENGILCVGTLANLVDDKIGIEAANGDYLSVLLFNTPWTGSPLNIRIYIKELIAGSGYTDYYTGTVDTLYYLKIKRDEAVGTYGTFYGYIYDDSGRTNLVDTLTLTLHEKEDFRYIYACQSQDGNDANQISVGYSENLDLQEAATAIPVFMHHYTQMWRN